MNQPPLDAASAELRCAADLADLRAGSDPFSAWTALAGQLRLIAAGLAPSAATDVPTRLTAVAHTAAALEHLDHVDPTADQDDLTFWRQQVEDLHERATRLASSSTDERGRS
ncbi:hypothetical protein [Intrasporangium calvum]|uniref:hypothetical protein n=1 Tax=Intrasporangium calvum TaxID=53358 RepID=UPI000DF5F6B0|nr:hypothetical protein [Intrasporangium calvum]AXG14522.1 hypothetical protein DN585_14875 [Intrasporangium calvum]